jgi:hypothetical protein
MTARKRESAARLSGSERAKRHAAVILEVFAGLRGTHEASEAMGVSPNRYYQLEARALTGLIAALEPLPRGRRKGPEEEVNRLKAENERLSREVTRLQSLVRVAQRSLGISVNAKPKKKAASRRRKPGHRGKKVVALLRKPTEDGSPEEAKAS